MERERLEFVQMNTTKSDPPIWIMKTKDGWYPVEHTDRCKPEDHAALNPDVIRIEELSGNVLWRRDQ